MLLFKWLDLGFARASQGRPGPSRRRPKPVSPVSAPILAMAALSRRPILALLALKLGSP